MVFLWCFCRGVLCGGVFVAFLWLCFCGGVFCGGVFVVDNNNYNNNSPPTSSPFHPFNSLTSLFHFSTRSLLPKFCLTCGVVRSYNFVFVYIMFFD